MKTVEEIKEEVVQLLGFGPPNPFGHGIVGAESSEAMKHATANLIRQAIDLAFERLEPPGDAEVRLRAIYDYATNASGGTLTFRHMAAILELIEGEVPSGV